MVFIPDWQGPLRYGFCCNTRAALCEASPCQQANLPEMPRTLHPKLLLWLLAVVLILPGCRTYFEAQFLKPAKADHPAHITEVQLVNGSKNPLASYACDGLAHGLGKTLRYTIAGSNELRWNRGSVVRATTGCDWSGIDSVCSVNNSNGVVWLRGVSVDSNLAITSTDEGAYTRYSAEQHVSVRYRWLFLDPTDGKVIDEFRGYADTTFTVRDSVLERVATPKISARSIAKRMVLAGGVAYANRIAPRWHSVNRYYYRTGNKQLRLGARAAAHGDWEIAQRHWESSLLQEPGRDFTKAKAAFNLAVAHEMLGQPREAIRWAQVSHYEYGEYDAGTYILLLRQRLLDSYHIREQM